MSLTFPAPCAAVSFLPAAAAQIEAFADAYETETLDQAARPEALRKLRSAIIAATAALIAGRTLRRQYPATYQDMAREVEEWLRVNRYWFGYVRRGDEAMVFAVLDATGNMPARR